jgi:hypothetical protein
VKKPRSTCLTCLGALLIGSTLAMVAMLFLSKLAVTFLMTIIQGGFDLIRDVLLGTVTAIAGLPATLALPLGVLVLTGVCWIAWVRRQRRQWRDLAQVREEYEPLVRLLKRKGLKVYLREIESLREKMFRERDRVEELRTLLAEDLPRLEARVGEMARLKSRATCDGERHELQTLMQELAVNSARLRAREGDLRAFEDSKVRLASKLSCLRLKLSDLSYDDTEIRQIMRGIDSVSFVADIIDAPSGTGTRAEPPEPASAEAPPNPSMAPPRVPEDPRNG